jgi:hypothetical protein
VSGKAARLTMFCLLCQEDVPAILEHLRVLHPAHWDGLGQWPDGAPVVVDDTLVPADFMVSPT